MSFFDEQDTSLNTPRITEGPWQIRWPTNDPFIHDLPFRSESCWRCHVWMSLKMTCNEVVRWESHRKFTSNEATPNPQVPGHIESIDTGSAQVKATQLITMGIPQQHVVIVFRVGCGWEILQALGRFYQIVDQICILFLTSWFRAFCLTFHNGHPVSHCDFQETSMMTMLYSFRKRYLYGQQLSIILTWLVSKLKRHIGA